VKEEESVISSSFFAKTIAEKEGEGLLIIDLLIIGESLNVGRVPLF
jgi:hypothetical protein